MGVKREFTGIKGLGYANSSIKVENKSSSDVRIEIKQQLIDEEKSQNIWLDLKTAIQLSKELRNVISQAKEII